ncbi:hypothetical protein QBC34DRAFT_360671 [Podospora aff. communis PSN243]|uniref:Nephrocystin 3-like N-terminal domain-containing protein n=1 Tax=Podospora aff. communis PSN243 TaxID=3040156 RepID=A0AAV9G7V1_9PEZI|nr:hypothetical protein QBC34DRAFT_360671 [Podospora aff. communis PSN243]
MDPLSVGASVIAFVGLADRVIRAAQFCIDTLRDAPSDIRMVFCEVSSLKTIVDILTLPDQPAPNSDSKGTIASIDPSFPPNWAGPIEACQRCLTSLEALLPSGVGVSAPDGPSPSAQGRRRLTLAELAWPLKQSKARKLLAEISQHKATLLLAISGDVLHELKDIKQGVRRIEATALDSERREICTWLERTNPSPLHNAAIRKHEPHTSAWLQRTAEWQDWLSSSSTDRLFWIYGIPGAGKTVLASFVIEELKRLCEETQDGAYLYAYYYCHYSHNQDESLPFLSWVVSQACRQTGCVPFQLKRLYDRGCEPTILDLERVLEIVLKRIETFYVVIDAVDESMPREELVRLIATMALDTRFQNIRILATSRQYFDIERVFSGVSMAISMRSAFVDADIKNYVHARLASSHRLRRWHDSLQDIENALVEKAEGMFRWVDCQIQAIERLRDPTQLMTALENLPRDLNETYIRIFDAISVADRPFVCRVLTWIIGHSRAPWMVSRGISAKVLVEAVAYDLHGPGRPSFDLDYIQELLGCLILVENEEDGDESKCLTSEAEDDTVGFGDAKLFVSLAHYTVLEFLTSPNILQSHVSCFATTEAAINSQFGMSVLQQAVAANPNGTSCDWVYDREAYCLTLGAALNIHEIYAFITTPEAKELFVRYIDPSSPHYRRFEAIQEHATCSDEEFSSYFWLRRLPAKVFITNEQSVKEHAARVLLSLVALGYTPGHGLEELLPYVLRGSQQFTVEDLLKTKVSAVLLDRDPETEGYAVMETHFEGEVGDWRTDL